MPYDPQGKGTWIATSANERVVCLLNGGLIKHRPSPPYRHSRGLVVTSFFEYDGFRQFVDQFEFTGLEPFTLVVIEHGNLYELRWTGEDIVINQPDPLQPRLWSSVTLYEPEVIAWRQNYFHDWLTEYHQQLALQPELIFDFHRFKEQDDRSRDIMIDREGLLKTVSITSVLHTNKHFTMRYVDLVRDQESHILQQKIAFTTAI